MEYRQELFLELNSNTAYSTVGAKQGDNNSRVVVIHVTENGVDYNLTENNVSAAYFRLRKPDGKAVINTAEIVYENNVIEILLTSQALAVAGRGYADITLMQGSQILSTISFILLIMASPGVAQEATSSNEFGYLNAVVEDATHTIYEAEAWAAGTRGGVDVYSGDIDSYQPKPSIKLSQAIRSINVDEDIFWQKVGHKIGMQRTFTFTYTEFNYWLLTTTTYINNTEIVSDPEIVSNIYSYGASLTFNDGYDSPEPNDIIEIVASEIDKPQVYKTSDIITAVDIEDARFWEKVGHKAGVQRTYDFTFTESQTWKLITITQEGTLKTTTNPEIVSNIYDYGVILSLRDGTDNPDVNDKVWIVIAEADRAYQNNAKFYSEQAEIQEKKIENLTVSAEASLLPGVEKTDNPVTGSYNLNFFLPKGDTGNVNLMTLFIDTDFESSTYGQVVVIRPDSMLATDFIGYPESIILQFDRSAFLSYVGINENSFKTYTFTYNSNGWFLDGQQIDLANYGISYKVKAGYQLYTNDQIQLKYIEQVTFSINANGELVIGIDTEGI